MIGLIFSHLSQIDPRSHIKLSANHCLNLDSEYPSHGFIFQLPSVSPFSPVSNSCLHCPALASVFAPWIWCSPLLPTMFWLQPSTFPGQSFPSPLTIVDYIICRAQCIMKMWILWFKKQKKGLCSFFCGLSLICHCVFCYLLSHSSWSRILERWVKPRTTTSGTCVAWACLALTLPASPGPDQGCRVLVVAGRCLGSWQREAESRRS